MIISRSRKGLDIVEIQFNFFELVVIRICKNASIPIALNYFLIFVDRERAIAVELSLAKLAGVSVTFSLKKTE